MLQFPIPSSLLTNHIPHLIPESALVSAWNSDSNLSLLIVRHPLARLVSVYYNKLVQYTLHSTVQYSTLRSSSRANNNDICLKEENMFQVRSKDMVMWARLIQVRENDDGKLLVTSTI